MLSAFGRQHAVQSKFDTKDIGPQRSLASNLCGRLLAIKDPRLTPIRIDDPRAGHTHALIVADGTVDPAPAILW